MMGLVPYAAGVLMGITVSWLWTILRRRWSYDSNPHRAPRADLPPATSRAIAADRRANRLELGVRTVRSGFGDGLDLTPKDRPRSRDDYDFDGEVTHDD